VSGAANAPRAELAALQIADPPEAWQALGFTVSADGVLVLGGVELWLDAAGRGITGWTLRRISLHHDVDGLPTGVTTEPPLRTRAHPNGALGVDHVVVTTPDFDRTAAALEAAGIPLRRIRDAGGFRQGFRRLGPAILELVEARTMPAGPARFWGLVVTVADLVGLRARLAPHLGEIRDAVQPRRQIATLDQSAGLSLRIAFMDPE
jgi:catechol 2,3-dioxygenase-like lactoylglutathione lyase family enzyme